MATKKIALQFGTMAILDVPKSRDGKHKVIITRILRELDQLEPGAALRVPLEVIGDIKANVRSALNRATRKAKRRVATAADDEFLYIWNVPADLVKRSTPFKF